MASLYLVIAAVGVGQVMVFVMLPVIADATGVGPGGISVAMAAGILAFLPATLFWGPMSDRRGRRAVMLLGSLGVLLGQLLLILGLEAGAAGLLGPDAALLVLTLSRVVYGGSAAALLPVARARIGDSVPGSRQVAAFGALGVALSLGRFTGPLLASLLILVAPFAPAYALFVIALATSAALLLHRFPEPEAAAKGRRARLRCNRRILRLAAAVLCMTAVVGHLQFTVGLHIQNRLGLDPLAAAQAVGLLLTVAAAATLGAQVLIVRRLRAAAATPLALACGTMALGVASIYAAESHLPLVLGAAAVGGAVAVAVPICLSRVTGIAGPESRGGALAILSAAQTLGFAVGALAGGTYAVSPALSYACAFAVAVSAPLLARGGLAGAPARASDGAKGA